MGVPDQDIEALCEHPDIVAEISNRCLAVCKAAKLVAFETPRKYALIADTFSPENDILTAALKLKRPVAAKVHKKTLETLYN